MAETPSPDRPAKPAPRAAKPLPPKQQAMAAKAAQAQEDPSDEQESDEELEEGFNNFLMFSAVPSWMISMVVHIILLLILAMFSFSVDKDKTPAPTFDVGKDVEEHELEEFQHQEIDAPESTDIVESEQPQPIVAEVVEETLIETPSTDLDAAPMEVQLDPLGESTAPHNDMSREIGAYTGTGLEGRGAAARAGLLREGGGTPGSEAAVAAALQWLANHQNSDGSWSWDHRRGPCQNRCENPGTLDASNGATGLALLPFLGAGNTHLEGQYKETVKRGLEYLLQNMKVSGSRGDLADGGNMYSHGICSIALCEAYAMTQDGGLQRPAQMAINHIIYAQDPVGGGWRYAPQEPGDTSVVGWQLMALKSAHMAYLEVPGETIMGASRFLDSVQEDSGSKYGYTGPGTGSATTSVGLLCRMYLGWKRDHGALQRGVEFLSQQGPSVNPGGANMYYNYYATQIVHHYGGEEWKQWNEVMREWLISTQSHEGHQEGSWYFAGDHGSPGGGRLYITCMATMILEVYYRHMPLYREQASEDAFPL